MGWLTGSKAAAEGEPLPAVTGTTGRPAVREGLGVVTRQVVHAASRLIGG